jgi:hypothetical protein
MKKYIQIQIKKIEIDKWCEGCRIEKDPGRQYVSSWIDRNARSYKEWYELSKCKHCLHWRHCGHKLLPSCDSFEPDSSVE